MGVVWVSLKLMFVLLPGCSGSWKSKSFKAYNFDALGVPPSRGHYHPLMKVRTEIRQIFLEMGCVFVWVVGSQKIFGFRQMEGFVKLFKKFVTSLKAVWLWKQLFAWLGSIAKNCHRKRKHLAYETTCKSS